MLRKTVYVTNLQLLDVISLIFTVSVTCNIIIKKRWVGTWCFKRNYRQPRYNHLHFLMHKSLCEWWVSIFKQDLNHGTTRQRTDCSCPCYALLSSIRVRMRGTMQGRELDSLSSAEWKCSSLAWQKYYLMAAHPYTSLNGRLGSWWYKDLSFSSLVGNCFERFTLEG